jgi:hypothetical protein
LTKYSFVCYTMYIMRNNNEREFNMLVSKWKDEFNFGVSAATNCLTKGTCAPKIVSLEDFTSGFCVFGAFGEILNMGESFETFEEAAKWMETVFTFEVKFDVV